MTSEQIIKLNRLQITDELHELIKDMMELYAKQEAEKAWMAANDKYDHHWYTDYKPEKDFKKYWKNKDND